MSDLPQNPCAKGVGVSLRNEKMRCVTLNITSVARDGLLEETVVRAKAVSRTLCCPTGHTWLRSTRDVATSASRCAESIKPTRKTLQTWWEKDGSSSTVMV